LKMCCYPVAQIPMLSKVFWFKKLNPLIVTKV